MITSWLVATFHLLALLLGFTAIHGRARALRGALDQAGLRRVFVADALWGVAALLWLATGLARAFTGLDKGSAYYFSNPLFHAKLTLFAVILGLEAWPMLTLIRWRRQRARGGAIDTAPARRLAMISDIQSALLIVMVFLATAIARGLRP